MPWSAPTHSGVLVALTVAMGRSSARMAGAVGSAAGAALALPVGWLAVSVEGCRPAGGPSGAAGVVGGAVQASSASPRPMATQRLRRTTSNLLWGGHPAPGLGWARTAPPSWRRLEATGWP